MPTAPAACPEAPTGDRPAGTEPLSVHVHRAGRTLYLLDARGAVVASEPVGIGRGGLGEKRDMADLVTPTGTFLVDLVLTADGTRNAVSPAAVERFAGDPLLEGPGLAALFRSMNGIDFDGDGVPDGAYGTAYIGLDAVDAVTGPKLRRYRDGTPYWFSIALHGTPVAANLGAAASGGCVHVSPTLLERLVGDGILGIGSRVVISDEAHG
ncbi:MAG: L,D-transpeptidase [Alphaproteobacteria bacterium]|nr:L,D-transpeptidase [Alphaproteobacteria bacterium]